MVVGCVDGWIVGGITAGGVRMLDLIYSLFSLSQSGLFLR